MSQPWYDYGEINNYGFYPDPDGNFPKPDVNFSVPSGNPITNLLSGVISGINLPGGGIPGWGQAVTIKLDKPLNSAATYEAYLHLGSLSTSDFIGEHVNVGDTIGYAGVDAGGDQWRAGYALQSGPYYGTGAGFSNPGSALLNPDSVIQAAKNNTLSSLTTINTSDSSGANNVWSVISGVIAGATGGSVNTPGITSFPSINTQGLRDLGINSVFIFI